MFWNLYRYVSEKILAIEKHKIFKVFDLRFFTQIFILQQCLEPNLNLNPFPNPNFFFGFGYGLKCNG
jgi:hypothetical protein